MAALMRSGARNASETVLLTLRALQGATLAGGTFCGLDISMQMSVHGGRVKSATPGSRRRRATREMAAWEATSSFVVAVLYERARRTNSDSCSRNQDKNRPVFFQRAPRSYQK